MKRNGVVNAGCSVVLRREAKVEIRVRVQDLGCRAGANEGAL